MSINFCCCFRCTEVGFCRRSRSTLPENISHPSSSSTLPITIDRITSFLGNLGNKGYPRNMIKETNRKSTNRKLYCDVMHLPLHATLPDGNHVIIDAMTDTEITEMYQLIAIAANNGNGYGIDEYPTEKEFRQEIKGGHSFIVSSKECGKMLGAFSLANSKFYRGTDTKVADPIIIVKRSERGKGVGEFIFRHVVQFSKRLGYAGIYTDTFCNNIAMTKIIERTPGFQRVGHLPMGGKLPDGTVVGAYVYFKDLRNSNDDANFR